MLKEIDLSLSFSEKSHLSFSDQKSITGFIQEIRRFKDFGLPTTETLTPALDSTANQFFTPTFTNEFWTSSQRAADRLHEISYRACFKPQLPRFFIERLTQPGDSVYDPFMGRGTTLLEAALLNRVPVGNDINPLSAVLVRPRLNPPSLPEVQERLEHLDWNQNLPTWNELLVFYHPETLREIEILKAYLLKGEQTNTLDAVDDWIRMVAINRLTGHSPGFFSVYTLPPNQAVSIKSQEKINRDRNQVPPRRSVPALILKKSKSLLKEFTPEKAAVLRSLSRQSLLTNCHSAETKPINDETVSLVVTSPPFLDIVQYASDNWLRCWFIGIDAQSVNLTVPARIEDWQLEMTRTFRELRRVLKPGGHIAFEVGEVRKGKIKLEEVVLTCGSDAGLKPLIVLVNHQEFTKTANCWGVENNSKGTNSNRIVLFRKAS
jgi:hypothetical protein